jgi:hypothetical protein
MSERKTFEILFSIPQIDSAFMRNPAGGGRLKIDVEQSTVAAVNAMLDEAVVRAGTTFAAVVVIVGQPENRENTQVVDWREGKRRKVKK